MNLDLIAALMTGATSVLIFSLHAMTSPKHQRWLDVPEYVRVGLAALGLVAMVRSVNLITLARDGVHAMPGHVNWEALFTAGATFYLIASVSYWVSKAMRDWSRLELDSETRTARGVTKIHAVINEGPSLS